MVRKYIGGSFAPPLNSEMLAAYREAIGAGAPDDLRESLLGLCDMVGVFQQTPESSTPRSAHPTGVGFIQYLDDAEVKRIWDVVPWGWECEALQARLDCLPMGSPIRNPAFHLLWFAKELAKDREPCTSDKL